LDPLPIRISVGDRQLSDSTGRAEDSADGAQHQNGNGDSTTEQSHVATESSQARAARTSQGNARGRNDPGVISDGSETAKEVNGEADVREDGVRCEQSLKTSPRSRSSGGPPTQINVRHSDDLVFVAAGHEKSVLVQKKPQRKSDERNKRTQQTLRSSHVAAASSPVEPQTAADERSVDIASVSAGHTVQTSCSNGVGSGALVTRTNNQCAEAVEHGMLNHSASFVVEEQHISGHRRSSSNAGLFPSASTPETAAQSESDEYRVVGQPASNGDIKPCDYYDIIPSSAQFSMSSAAIVCDTTTVPSCSSHLSAVSRRDAVSPSHSDGSQNDLVTGDMVHQNHADCSDAIPPRNGIGRGQLLRMMLDNRQHRSNDA